MSKTLLICGLILFLSACGGGGGGGGSSTDNNDTNTPNNNDQTNDGTNNNGNTGVGLFQALDEALAQRVVSTTDPSGLWMFYSEGTNHFESTQTGGSLVSDTTINLYAFVASIFNLNQGGSLKLTLSRCTGGYNGIGDVAQGADSTTQLTIPLWQIMTDAFYPYVPGDATLDADYQAYKDSEVTLTIVDNREILFPAEISFTDAEGDITGTVSATFKARKFSDNVNDSLGDFIVNSVNRDSHCFTLSNQFTDQTSDSVINGQNFVLEDDYMQEVFSIVSFPNLTDGISSVLLQERPAYTHINNGQEVAVDALISLAVSNTNKQFPNVTGFSAHNTHMIDRTLNFSVNTGVTLDFSVSDGANTLTGTAEALY